MVAVKGLSDLTALQAWRQWVSTQGTSVISAQSEVNLARVTDRFQTVVGKALADVLAANTAADREAGRSALALHSHKLAMRITSYNHTTQLNEHRL